MMSVWVFGDFPGGSDDKESACNMGGPGSMKKIPWRRKWQSATVFLPGESRGQTGLVGYSPWDCYESDMMEWLVLPLFFFSCKHLGSLSLKRRLWPKSDSPTCHTKHVWKALSVQSLSHVQLFATPWMHARPPCPSPTPGVHPNPCPSSRWCHPTFSSSVVCSSSCRQSFPALGSFPVSQLFASGGQSIGVSGSTSVLPMNTQYWSPLRWTGWISLQSKGFSRVFSNTTVQKCQFLGAQLSSQSNSHIHTWPLEKP